MEKNKEFIELRDVWGEYTIKQIHRDKTRKLVKGLFRLGLLSKFKSNFNKKSITKAICYINFMIPCTAWPITNPLIIKASNCINMDKIQRKINCFRIKF